MAKKRSTVFLLSLASSAALGGCSSDTLPGTADSELGQTAEPTAMPREVDPDSPCSIPTGLCAPTPTIGSIAVPPVVAPDTSPTHSIAIGSQVVPPVNTASPTGSVALPPVVAPGMSALPPTAFPGTVALPPSADDSAPPPQAADAAAPSFDFPGLMALPPSDAGAPTQPDGTCDAGDCAAQELLDAGDSGPQPQPEGPIFGGIVITPPVNGSGGSAAR